MADLPALLRVGILFLGAAQCLLAASKLGQEGEEAGTPLKDAAKALEAAGSYRVSIDARMRLLPSKEFFESASGELDVAKGDQFRLIFGTTELTAPSPRGTAIRIVSDGKGVTGSIGKVEGLNPEKGDRWKRSAPGDSSALLAWALLHTGPSDLLFNGLLGYVRDGSPIDLRSQLTIGEITRQEAVEAGGRAVSVVSFKVSRKGTEAARQVMVWIDNASKLPLRYRSRHKDASGEVEALVKYTFSRLGEPADQDLFRTKDE